MADPGRKREPKTVGDAVPREAPRRAPIIGIIGGIGSGKSALASAFETLGCTRLDADAVGHEVLDRPAVRDGLAEAFGPEVLGSDGRVDRPAVAERAFASDEATGTLNRVVGGVLWPEFRRRALAAAEGGAPVALDAALLLESGTQDLCDAIVLVDAPEATRRERVRETRGWDWEEVRRREARQIPLSRKRELADFVLRNDSDLKHLHAEARRILARVDDRAASSRKQSVRGGPDRGSPDR